MSESDPPFGEVGDGRERDIVGGVKGWRDSDVSGSAGDAGASSLARLPPPRGKTLVRTVCQPSVGVSG